jgi:Sec-independent protein translocase protein TatA
VPTANWALLVVFTIGALVLLGAGSWLPRAARWVGEQRHEAQLRRERLRQERLKTALLEEQLRNEVLRDLVNKDQRPRTPEER